MKLTPGQDLIYLWRYEGQFTAKLGVSTGKSLVTRINAAETNSHLDIQILGIELCPSRAESIKHERELLNAFTRIRPDREWIYLTQDVWDWIESRCEKEIPTYQQLKGLNGRLQAQKEYRQRRLAKPGVVEMLRDRSRRKMREIRADPVRNARVNARRRERYANDPEYRENKLRNNRKRARQRP